MSNRRRYRKCGKCTFRQLPLGEDQDFTFNRLFNVGGISGWRMYLKNVTNESGTSIYPYICCTNRRRKLKFGLRYLMNVINHRNPELKIVNEGKCYYTVGDSINGQSIMISELLNEENGWLKNGRLSIEYGIYVESMQGSDGIWEFNFRERIFHTGQENYTQHVYCFKHPYDNEFLECRQELINFASPDFHKRMKQIDLETVDFDLLENCLQIVNGVQLDLTGREQEQMILLAYSLNFPNVIRFCERQMIESCDINIFEDFFFFVEEIKFTIKYELNHYLNHLLKHINCPNILAIILHQVDFQKMSSETMKTCTKYFFNKKKEKSLKKMKRILRKLDVYDMPSEAVQCMIAKLVYNEF